MSAAREIISALIAGGMDAAEAAAMVARAAVEMSAGVAPKSAGALRQQRYRERNKASQSVTPEVAATVTNRNEIVTRDAGTEASQTVTNRNEVTLCDAASLSTESKKEEKETRKRERAAERRASQLPDGWRPGEKQWQDAIAALGSEDRAERELRKFTNHALDKGRIAKNWNAAWNNWVDRAVEWGNVNGSSADRANPTAGRATAREADLVAALGRGAMRVLEERYPAGRDRTISGGANTAGQLDLAGRAKGTC